MMQPSRRKSHQSRAWRSLFKKQFHKTKLCRYFQLGQCRYGQDCPFAHNENELTVAPDLTKTTMCVAWMAGNCPIPSEQCQYAHGEEELRVTPVFSSSTICKRKGGQEEDEMSGNDSSPTGPNPFPQGQAAPAGVGFLSTEVDHNWPMAHGEVQHMAGAMEGPSAGQLPINLDLLSAAVSNSWTGGATGPMHSPMQGYRQEAMERGFRQEAMEPEHFQGFAPPGAGMGPQRGQRKPARKERQGMAPPRMDSSNAVVHLADHLRGAGALPHGGASMDPAPPRRNPGTRADMMLPQAPPAAAWPSATALQTAEALMAAAGSPMPARNHHINAPTMFGLGEGLDSAVPYENDNCAPPMTGVGQPMYNQQQSPLHRMFGLQEPLDPQVAASFDKHAQCLMATCAPMMRMQGMDPSVPPMTAMDPSMLRMGAAGPPVPRMTPVDMAPMEPPMPPQPRLPVSQMYARRDRAEPAPPANHDKQIDLAAYCAAALADAQTATPGSLASLSSTSRMRWARTPSSAASPERTGRLWDRTSSVSPARSPQREHSPAYIAPAGMVTFHGLPEEEEEEAGQNFHEPPLSPEMRWARTPSTVASPSVSPPRRVGGRLRVTNRGPPTVAPHCLSTIHNSHNLGSIFQLDRKPGDFGEPRGEQSTGAASSSSASGTAPNFGALWQSPLLPSADGSFSLPASSSPLGGLLGSAWMGGGSL